MLNFLYHLSSRERDSMSDITKIIIAGRNISGFGGMETVFSTFSRLLTESGKNYQISFVFFNELNNSVDDTWLGNNPFTRFSSSLKNGKLKRVYFACKFASVIKKTNPDYVIAFDSVGCYISRLALRFAFKRIPLFSWNHFLSPAHIKQNISDSRINTCPSVVA